MGSNDINIQYVAHLARLNLTSEEQEQFGAQLSQIIHYIGQLNELDVSGIEPTAHAMPLVNITRPDEIQPSLPHAEAMRNAPSQANGLFMAPKIVE